MPELKPTTLTAYSFTEEEYRRACVLSELTTKYIQTELAIAAEKKLALTVDTESRDPNLLLMLGNEYYRGVMEAYGSLLATSENTKDDLQRQLKELQESQSQN